jgi:hypothetical protein
MARETDDSIVVRSGSGRYDSPPPANGAPAMTVEVKRSEVSATESESFNEDNGRNAFLYPTFRVAHHGIDVSTG